MHLTWGLFLSLLLTPNLVFSIPAKRHYDTHNYYVLEHLPQNGAAVSEITDALGVELVEQAGEMEDTWLVRMKRRDSSLEPREEDDPVLATFADLQARASSTLVSRSEDVLHAKRLVSSVNFLELQIPRQLVKRAPPSIRPPASSKSVAQHFGIKDPLFKEQWHLVNDEYPEHMMNITPVWEMGLTGKGVLTSFLDDGLDNEAEDLKDAFDAKNSYDFNAHVPLPRPTGVRDHHGTRCAGQVTARRNNACGVGIAYDAKAAGVRILGGPISSVDEAAALNYGFQEVSLYSCSWGPRDNGQTMEGPSYIIRKAVVNGIKKGRGGKGSIFVFASGNGGRNGDQCNFDGYTNSIYSVTVGSVDYKGNHPTYSEACAANMIVAYSSGSGQHIVTTDRGKNECSRTHGGTSAAAPNVVGVFALALQARPDLTWRDMQYLSIETAKKINPNDPDWEKTASGRMYSYNYGYGVIDGHAYVTAAKEWKLVKPQAWFQSDTVRLNNGKITRISKKKYKYEGGVKIPPGGIKNTIEITQQNLTDHNLETMEHIDIRVWISHSRRGDVQVEIVSPNGIKSVLAKRRENDESDQGFPGWRFNSIKHWGENPVGNWTLSIKDQDDDDERGSFLGWNLVLWGTTVDPSKVKEWIEPVEDYALPPKLDPTRPVINDPELTHTTTIAKPTEHIPPDEGHTPGGNKNPPGNNDEVDSDGIFDSMKGLISGKHFFTALGVVFVGLIAALLFVWRRRTAKQRLAQYQTLNEDDIHMDTIEDDRDNVAGDSRTTRQLYNSFGAASSEQVLPPQPVRSAVDPPNAKGLGFHSSFLEDDEPSAGLTPKYRDEPEDDDDDDDVPRQHPRDLVVPNTGDLPASPSQERLTS